MAHQVNSIDYGDYRYKVGDTIKIAPGKEYLYPATTGNSYTKTPNISQDVRKITQIWASDANLSVSNPIVTAYHSGPQRYGGGAIRPEQIAVGSGGLKIKHYVKYNANGGTGAPGTQTKVYGSVLTLSSAKPTRIGHTFQGWATSASGGVSYAAGASYSVDADLTLYAVWKADTYTVSYDANGGIGAPGTQAKTYGVTLFLSNTEPTRLGYHFQGWATSAWGDVAYTTGAAYTENASITLYAVWKADVYTVSYNANGGTGAPETQNKQHDVDLKLSDAKPIRENYNFKGWGTSSSSTTAAYAPGELYTQNASVILYAIWELAYTAPRIEDFTVMRCDSAGNGEEDGIYAKASFRWTTDKPVSEIRIEYKTELSTTWTAITVTATGTSGTVSKIIGGSLSIEYTYNIRITVSDSVGSSSAVKDVPSMHYIIDVRSTGKGIAFGQPAGRDAFDVNMDAYFKKGFQVQGKASFTGNAEFAEDITNHGEYYDKHGKRINNGLAVSSSPGINPDNTLEELILTNVNTPMGGNKYMYIRTMFYSEKSTTANRAQYAVPYANFGSMYHRYYYGGNWSSWIRMVRDDEFSTVNERITNMTDRLAVLESNLPCRIRQGTKVMATTGGSTEVVVFTGAQLNALFGINNASNVNATVILMNGDLAADTKMFATYYRNGDWLYKVDRAYSGGQIRVNYIAVYNG